MADTSDTFSAESRLIHAGTDRTPGLPATPPLAPTSVYVSAGPPRPGRAYGRDGNPGWEALEQALGGLEDAEAVAFASGQAASMALMLALAPGRERIVLPNDGYYGGRVLADRLRPHGAVPVPVDLQDLAAVECELTAAPSVLWAETPTNPLLRVADLARLGELAAAAGAPMVVDNTVATGLLQRPLEAGAMASLYSLTKSVSGHSDVILGAVVSRDADLLAALRAWRSSGGGIPGPFEAWLALRGLKTLPLRIARQSHTALAIARHLTGHPRVAAVHYPGIDTSTSEVARRQMPDGFGPLLSFEVLPGNAEAADMAVASSRLILPATSFGGVESTWERRARWPGETAPAALIRMSVGVEPAAGYTWLSRDAIRTGANTEMKRLMLTHAFEVWQVRSVCLHTDARNQRSRDAMQRIGARFEGILRAHRLGADLNPRDSVRFSITAAEWPSVRLRLDELARRYQPA